MGWRKWRSSPSLNHQADLGKQVEPRASRIGVGGPYGTLRKGECSCILCSFAPNPTSSSSPPGTVKTSSSPPLPRYSHSAHIFDGNNLTQNLPDLGKPAQRAQQLHHPHQCAAHAQVDHLALLFQCEILIVRSRRPSLASGPAFSHLSRSEPSDENYVKVN